MSDDNYISDLAFIKIKEHHKSSKVSILTDLSVSDLKSFFLIIGFTLVELLTVFSGMAVNLDKDGRLSFNH